MPRTEEGEAVLSIAGLTQRCRTLAAAIGTTLGLPGGEVSLASDVTGNGATMSLGGRASEVISRNRGRPHRVLPLCAISGDVFGWVGYREGWDKRGGEQMFRFMEGGFTLHIGRAGEIEKPQVMRSEWVGPRSRSFEEHAGHPHWQMDALESSRNRPRSVPAVFGEEPSGPIEFEETTPTPADLLRRLTLERVHLASAATWWRQGPQAIAHAPASVADLDRWVLGCLSYLRQEMGRCQICAPA